MFSRCLNVRETAKFWCNNHELCCFRLSVFTPSDHSRQRTGEEAESGWLTTTLASTCSWGRGSRRWGCDTWNLRHYGNPPQVRGCTFQVVDVPLVVDLGPVPVRQCNIPPLRSPSAATGRGQRCCQPSWLCLLSCPLSGIVSWCKGPTICNNKVPRMSQHYTLENPEM